MRRFYVLHERTPAKIPKETKSATPSRISGAQPISETASRISPDLSPGTAFAERIPRTLSAELARRFTLGWSHYVTLLSVGDADARRFYEIEAADGGWSVRELKRQNDAIVELTLPEDANIYASKYQLYLPSKQELAAQLADVQREIEQREGGGRDA